MPLPRKGYQLSWTGNCGQWSHGFAARCSSTAQTLTLGGCSQRHGMGMTAASGGIWASWTGTTPLPPLERDSHFSPTRIHRCKGQDC